mmetsp:Transcript_28956/g.75955  ORF Transcript_28956/g.75955 Transcript_28956/m.75955 type:complete len:190 (-) Transcript_28956:248-817(-)
MGNDMCRNPCLQSGRMQEADACCRDPCLNCNPEEKPSNAKITRSTPFAGTSAVPTVDPNVKFVPDKAADSIHSNSKAMESIITRNMTGSPRTIKVQASLHEAAEKGDLRAVKFYLRFGSGHIDINCADHNGNTALHKAAWEGHVEVVLALLEEGASTDTLNHENLTPMDMARKTGRTSVITLLGQLAGQ